MVWKSKRPFREPLNTAIHNKLVSFILSIADYCLRDVYVRGKYRDVILPMVVVRRLNALLEPTKEAVLQEKVFQLNEVNLSQLNEAEACRMPRATCFPT